jgi:Zn-dependent M28 family amino/carboxypeptidase
MRKTIILFVALIGAMNLMWSQQPPARNSTIVELLSRVSEERLRQTVERLVGFGTRHTLSDTTSNTRGIGAARRWIKSEFERYARASGGRMEVTFHRSLVQPSARIPQPTVVVNVVATLRPSKPSPTGDRIIVVGGHYDSRASDPMDPISDAPGANDDGSGTALVLELARLMATMDTEATLIFIAFAGEEQGLVGATQWAEMARLQGWNLEAMFNSDIVGSTRGGDGSIERDYVRLFSEAYSPLDTGSAFRRRNSLGLENDGPSRSLARYIAETGAAYVPGFAVKLIYRRDRFLRGGDHSPFHDRGFAAVRFSVARENYDWQHQNVRVEKGKEYGDLPKFMDFPYLAAVTRVNLASVASLAVAPAAPREARIITRELGYETELQWKANSEPDLAGYYVRYRETTSPLWQHSVFTTDTSITLKVLKDDFLFAVQAVDKEGNASLFAIPTAGR